MWDYVVKGGPVMVPIILGSLVGLTIIIEKAMVFFRLRMDSSEFVQEVFKDLKTSRPNKALLSCERAIAYPLAAVFKIGIERRNLPPERLDRKSVV